MKAPSRKTVILKKNYLLTKREMEASLFKQQYITQLIDRQLMFLNQLEIQFSMPQRQICLELIRKEKRITL